MTYLCPLHDLRASHGRLSKELLDFKGIFFDLFDTLVVVEMDHAQAFDVLFSSLVAQGFDISYDKFKPVYFSCREEIRAESLSTLKEQTNSIAIAESLGQCGIHVDSSDQRLTNAVDAQFEPFILKARLLSGALELLRICSESTSVGIISNFSYAPVVRRLLSRLKIDSYLEGIIVSNDVGYRKPHERIFQVALETLKSSAKDSVMIGDSIAEDIAGAKAVGMGTILVLNDKKYTRSSPSSVLPDRTISDLSQLLAMIHW